ncbi:hypothetical protein B0T25DRAFT_179403 [Lasiosphaeria hispida]|uniref:Uncharacterized protein n=1 Tax=Lasiosphaeria hispida TaxID=260671 RepID=A0AAJ0HGG1_9PEZI|nr:hypothetical protein B0T25DRAFT_179403 [Lasiosphaeria hispida]
MATQGNPRKRGGHAQSRRPEHCHRENTGQRETRLGRYINLSRTREPAPQDTSICLPNYLHPPPAFGMWKLQVWPASWARVSMIALGSVALRHLISTRRGNGYAGGRGWSGGCGIRLNQKHLTRSLLSPQPSLVRLPSAAPFHCTALAASGRASPRGVPVEWGCPRFPGRGSEKTRPRLVTGRSGDEKRREAGKWGGIAGPHLHARKNFLHPLHWPDASTRSILRPRMHCGICSGQEQLVCVQC